MSRFLLVDPSVFPDPDKFRQTLRPADPKAEALACAMDRQRLEGKPPGSTYIREHIRGEFGFVVPEDCQVRVHQVQPGARVRQPIAPRYSA